MPLLPSLPLHSRFHLFVFVCVCACTTRDQLNYIRCSGSTTLDDLAPHLFPFVLTSAWPQLRLSIDPSNAALAAKLTAAGISGGVVTSEDEGAFEARMAEDSPYNVITPGLDEFPLVGQFCSLLLCVGHIKSTQPDDVAFVEAFKTSPKWLVPRK